MKDAKMWRKTKQVESNFKGGTEKRNQFDIFFCQPVLIFSFCFLFCLVFDKRMIWFFVYIDNLFIQPYRRNYHEKSRMADKKYISNWFLMAVPKESDVYQSSGRIHKKSLRRNMATRTSACVFCLLFVDRASTYIIRVWNFPSNRKWMASSRHHRKRMYVDYSRIFRKGYSCSIKFSNFLKFRGSNSNLTGFDINNVLQHRCL